VLSIEDDAVVVRLANGKTIVCADYGEFLVYAPDGSITPKIGLNSYFVTEHLRKFAFPSSPTGAAFIRWPTGEPLPKPMLAPPFGVLAFSRQTLQPDRSGGWVERRTSLHVFVTVGNSVTELHGKEKRRLIRGFLRATIRKSSDLGDDVPASLQGNERDLISRLRRPNDSEMAAQVRHAVTPLLAAVATE
jgi:hypothetical protein